MRTCITTTARVRAIALLMLSSLATHALADSAAIKIVRVSGTVNINAAGQPVNARVGATFSSPARVETASDGSLRIEQDSSSLDIGPNSVVLLPGANGNDEKIIQNRGRVLYSVKPRKARSFSVETPYLVSVVKGTIFTVAIENESTAVALLEGSVELIADGVPSVMLSPNETGRRGAHERSIELKKIDTTPPPAPQARAIPSAAQSTPSTDLNATEPARAIAPDLNEIGATQAMTRATLPVVPPADVPTPDTDPSPEPQTPDDPLPVPETPDEPAPAPSTPDIPAPPVDPTPVPPPVVDPPQPPVPDDDDDDRGHCGKKWCDSDDDHDRGGGNDK